MKFVPTPMSARPSYAEAWQIAKAIRPCGAGFVGAILVLAAEDIPTPTYTSPRLWQIHRILGDLHLLKLAEEGTAISTEGTKLLENLS